jgi:hypothetical protein
VPFDYKIDARDAMDAHYGAGNWFYRTAPHVGSDLGAALNAAMSASRTAGYPRQEVLIPPTGPWYMSTPIDPVLLAGSSIHGASGPWGTSIYFDSDAQCFDYIYTDDAHEGGMLEDLFIILEKDHPNALCCIRMNAVAAGAPGGYVFQRLRVSTADATSSWQYPFAANGMARIGPPQGIRGLTIRDSMFFKGRLGGMWAAGILFMVLDNVGFYVPATAQGADVVITGGGTGPTNNVQIFTTGLVANKITIVNSDIVMGTMKSTMLTVNNTLTHSSIFHAGPVSGTQGSGFVTSV